MSEADPGYGPPPGNPTGPARGGGIPFEALARASSATSGLVDPFGGRSVDAGEASVDRARVKLVYNDIPIVTIQNTWSVEQMRHALYAHLVGIFDGSAQLCDSILGDDRVTACLTAKATTLFGQEVCSEPATVQRVKGSKAAQECHDAFMSHWPMLAENGAFREINDYTSMMGFSHSQILWTKSSTLQFAPLLRPWHARFEYYDWWLRRYMAITDGPVVPIVPGSGKWFEMSFFTPYRAWIHGAIRPVTEPWALRHFGFRDMARFGEVHGNPTRKGYVPAVGDPIERAAFEAAISSLGANTSLIVPRGVDSQDNNGYDYELVEAQSKSWEVHPAQIDRCDMAITLAILMSNLPTEVKSSGGYAAADVQMDVRQGGAKFENLAWKGAIYRDIARPFAYLNFGDADLAPWVWRNVTSRDEYQANADQWNKVGTGLNQFAQAGMRFKDAGKVRDWVEKCFGMREFPEFEMTEPKVAGGPGGDAPPGSAPKGGKSGPAKSK